MKTKPKDHRTPLAQARDEFLASAEGLLLCDVNILAFSQLGHLLDNRISHAWLAGAAWGQAHPFPRGGGRTNRRTSVPDYHGAPSRA
jgi:hypothetical protein